MLLAFVPFEAPKEITMTTSLRWGIAHSNASVLHVALLLFLLASCLHVDAQCEDNEVIFTSSTGQWGLEMTWELYHVDAGSFTLVGDFQGTGDFTATADTLCLADGCYALLALDSWGDGWNGGGVEADALDPAVTLDGFESEFALADGGYGYHTFSIGTEDCVFLLPGCTDPEALNFVQGANSDDGSCAYIETFEFDDEGASSLREYIYYAPAGLEPGAPLVFVLHGYSGSGLGMYGYSGFREIADQEGFAVVFPQGAPDLSGTNHWNANFNFTNVNDHAFLTQLAVHLQETYNHDPACTYSCGYSNGGYMSYSLACANADTFRGIGSVGGLMSGNDWATCAPSQQVPVVHIHGTNDFTVPYAGNSTEPDWGGSPGVEEIVSTWAAWNNCTEVATTSLPDLDPTDGSTVDLITHSGGDSGYEARVYRVNDGGHDWFGSWGNFDITSAAEMWSFWSQFCGAPIAVSELLPAQDELIGWDGQQFTALESCRLRVADMTGRTVLDRPLVAGQSIPFAGSGQIFLWHASTTDGRLHRSKFLVN